MTVTIYDVAREAGVSMATVSRVVNNNPNVKPQTRKKVFEAIERLGIARMRLQADWQVRKQRL